MFKKIIFQLFPIIGIVLCCCSSAPSLQTYFVDNQEKNGFISIDVPISVLGLESIEMSSSEKEALSSISNSIFCHLVLIQLIIPNTLRNCLKLTNFSLIPSMKELLV